MKKTRWGVAAAAVALAAVAGTAPGASAGAAARQLSVSPNPAKAPATITVGAKTASDGCGGDDVTVDVYNVHEGQYLDQVEVPLDQADSSDDQWQTTIPVPNAGDYVVSGTCVSNENESFLFSYAPADLDVDANLVATPSTALVGSTHAITPASSGLCDGGTVALSIKAPDGSTSSATPIVDGSGAWSSPLTTSQVGTYTVTGTCTQTARSTDGSLGQLSAAQAAPGVEFSYGPVDVVATAAATSSTTTTTAPPAEAQPAVAVRAQPTFTG